MDLPITIKELYASLKGMPKSKTPDKDGLTPSFYLVFWDKIVTILYDVYLYAIQNKKLHLSARRGLITVIPKKARNTYMVRSWRPLSMLNTDYKILAKTIV